MSLLLLALLSSDTDGRLGEYATDSVVIVLNVRYTAAQFDMLRYANIRII